VGRRAGMGSLKRFSYRDVKSRTLRPARRVRRISPVLITELMSLG
jgi:hypothetical protein